MEQAFAQIKQLVEDFKNNEKFYLSDKYQESQARQDFIDKFFAALGWDVTHERQKNPYEQEVKIENKVSTQGSQRRADYAFFITPNFRDVKFYAEAKKPAKNLKDAAFYHQTIRYGWNSGTPIAVLTDFEEFHILDCRYKPDIDDALNRKLEYFHYSEYADVEKFKKIFFLFGREAVANGSLEKYAATLSKPRGKAIQRGLFKGGYQPVDEAFLEELDSYRETLAKAFKKENPDLGSEELTEAVQRTIDRLVFIRFLEDKQIEDPQIINYSETSSAWKKFSAHCRSLEPKYNGLVFKKHHIIDDTNFVPMDDKTFADICEELANPSSPYDFDKIPISILGSIYERFLGKVVRVTPKGAKVEPKPEVRKAGGVYYTPQYIVRYIIKETVGKLLYGETEEPSEGHSESKRPSEGNEWKTPEEVAKMSFADIACGSGSFLIEVYTELLEYHERYYAAHPEAAKKGDLSTRDGKQVLSLKKRQEILVNNIYGVDIDSQATEVTQLSLYLKLLEEATLNDAVQFSMLKEKLLPDLKNNIVCGNSLIGTDINTGELFENNETQSLKPMNFEDAFPSVMKRGGFDAVVGNPPYVRQEGISDKKEYFKKRYTVYNSIADLYVYFIEKAFTILRPNGLFGYIVANKWIRANFAVELRSWLKKQNIKRIIDFGDLPVFKNVTTYPCILLIEKASPQNEILISEVESLDLLDLSDFVIKSSYRVNQSELSDNGWMLANETIFGLMRKIDDEGTKLEKYINNRLYRGIISGLNEAFIISKDKKEELERKNPKSIELFRPYLLGKDIKRYEFPDIDKFLIFIPNGWTKKRYTGKRDKWKVFEKEFPAVAKHLRPFETQAKKRYDQGEYWWELRACDYYEEFEKEKIMLPDISLRGNFILDTKHRYCANTCYMIGSDSKYLLGILNSSLITFYYGNIASVYSGGYLRYFIEYMSQIPIRTIDFTNEAEKAKHDHIVSLVEQILKSKEELAAAKLDSDVQRLELRCTTLDHQIDEAVYKLYGLTPEEIAIVEGKA